LIELDGFRDYISPYDGPRNDIESFKALLDLAGLREVEIHDGIGLDISEPDFHYMLRTWPYLEAMYNQPRYEAWCLSHSISLADLDQLLPDLLSLKNILFHIERMLDTVPPPCDGFQRPHLDNVYFHANHSQADETVDRVPLTHYLANAFP
jgi:hypothetical protein